MNIKYYAADGAIKSLGDNELAHYKYIKKIKSGNGYRYFYSQDEIDAYYKDKVEYDKTVDNEYQRELSSNSKKNNWKSAEKKTKDSNFNRNAKPIDSEYEKAKKYNSQVNDYSGGKTNKDIERENRERKEARKNKIKDSINKKIDRTSKSIEKGRSAVEKRLNKAKNTAKNEAKGVKRVTKAINTAGEAKSKGTIYSKNGKTYRNWKETPSGTIKTYDGKTLGYDYHVEKSKKKKTGKAERAILGAYRKTPKGKRWSLTR